MNLCIKFGTISWSKVNGQLTCKETLGINKHVRESFGYCLNTKVIAKEQVLSSIN